MCYSKRNYELEEEARRLREEGPHGRRRAEAKSRRVGEREQKPPTDKVREMVGSVGRTG